VNIELGGNGLEGSTGVNSIKIYGKHLKSLYSGRIKDI
jgi:hypothetical protein